MTSFRQRFSMVPDHVDTVICGLGIAAIYFSVAAFLEWEGWTGRLPLAPAPWLGLTASVINACLIIGLFYGAGWVRPLVAMVPMVAYPFEYGATVPKLLSLQSFELLASFALFPAAVAYLLYGRSSTREWFSRGRELE